MIRRLRVYYNPWFIIPFIVWAMTGALLLLVYGSHIIFTTVNTHHTPFWDVVMLSATDLGNGNGIAIVLFLLLLFPSCRNWWYVIAAIACNAVPALLTQVLKDIFDAPRPLEYYNSANWIHIRQNWTHLYKHSFPSGHAAGVFSLFCFLSLLLPRHKEWVGLLFFVLALFVGYTRMYLAAHFYADVYVGSLIGTTTTLFCFAIMRRWRNTTPNIAKEEK